MEKEGENVNETTKLRKHFDGNELKMEIRKQICHRKMWKTLSIKRTEQIK